MGKPLVVVSRSNLGISVLAGLVLAGLVLAGVALGTADGPDFYDLREGTRDEGRALRAAADARAPAFGALAPGATCLRSRGCVGGLTFEEFSSLSDAERERAERERPRWCRVEGDAVTGWVPARALQEARGACHADDWRRALGRATYHHIYPEPVTLAGGVFEGAPFVEGAAARPRVELIAALSRRADLDGDGALEAVAFLSESSGGSGSNLYAAVLRPRGEDWINIGTALVGDRVQLRSLAVEGGRIRLDVLQAGPGDALCCPGELATREWTLTAEGLTEVRSEETGRLSLAAVAGREWVLAQVAPGERLPASAWATLRVEEDGAVSGSAGCNRFHGRLEETGTGELRAGPVAATRRMCPDPEMQLEDAYLPRLQSATGFGFHLGRLAIEWRLESGQSGVLLFDPGA
ncbi:MAG TPA: META domain-containing protein [Myxococcota bacterium]